MASNINGFALVSKKIYKIYGKQIIYVVAQQ